MDAKGGLLLLPLLNLSHEYLGIFAGFEIEICTSFSGMRAVMWTYSAQPEELH